MVTDEELRFNVWKENEENPAPRRRPWYPALWGRQDSNAVCSTWRRSCRSLRSSTWRRCTWASGQWAAGRPCRCTAKGTTVSAEWRRCCRSAAPFPAKWPRSAAAAGASPTRTGRRTRNRPPPRTCRPGTSSTSAGWRCATNCRSPTEKWMPVQAVQRSPHHFKWC